MLLLSAQYQLSKANRDERQRLAGMLASNEKRLYKGFTHFVHTGRQGASFQGNFADEEAVFKAVQPCITTFGKLLPVVYVDAAHAEFDFLGSRVIKKATRRRASDFDAANPRAVRAMRNAELSLVQDLSEKQRGAIRAALASAYRRGEGPQAAARMFVGSIGLTETQEATVDRYRDLLERGSKEALDRELRNRRFDRLVEQSIEDEEPLSTAQINRMVDAYRDSMLRFRAETIARTESLSIVSQAREEAMRQMAEQTDTELSDIRRTWRATGDSRTRDSHAEMDGQVVGADEPFVTPSGEELMYPGDKNGSAAEIIKCRCAVSYDFL